ERLHDAETAVAGPVAEGATQSGGLHLLGRALVVVARHGAVDDATAGVLRSADRALASATGALLAVRLLATTTDFGARLDLVRALAGSGELRGDDLVDQRNVDLSAEDVDGQIHVDRLCLLSLGHVRLPSRRCGRRRGRPGGRALRP